MPTSETLNIPLLPSFKTDNLHKNGQIGIRDARYRASHATEVSRDREVSPTTKSQRAENRN